MSTYAQMTFLYYHKKCVIKKKNYANLMHLFSNTLELFQPESSTVKIEKSKEIIYKKVLLSDEKNL